MDALKTYTKIQFFTQLHRKLFDACFFFIFIIKYLMFAYIYTLADSGIVVFGGVIQNCVPSNIPPYQYELQKFCLVLFEFHFSNRKVMRMIRIYHQGSKR